MYDILCLEDTHAEVKNQKISAKPEETRFRQKNRNTQFIRKIARFDRICTRPISKEYQIAAQPVAAQPAQPANSSN